MHVLISPTCTSKFAHPRHYKPTPLFGPNSIWYSVDRSASFTIVNQSLSSWCYGVRTYYPISILIGLYVSVIFQPHTSVTGLRSAITIFVQPTLSHHWWSPCSIVNLSLYVIHFIWFVLISYKPLVSRNLISDQSSKQATIFYETCENYMVML